ncbi:MAG: hypothetical protein KGH64_03695, partial [Candidatus Micrarchaeota archaeon]|nr:hypothetical protein [Candidatus Micrarchaeota archaeon]
CSDVKVRDGQLETKPTISGYLLDNAPKQVDLNMRKFVSQFVKQQRCSKNTFASGIVVEAEGRNWNEADGKVNSEFYIC